MKSNSEQLAILRDNIQFGLHQGKETKASLSRKTGITRSTIYKILDGKVERVQAATVEKIADFLELLATSFRMNLLNRIILAHL